MKDKIKEILPKYNIHGTGIMPITDQGIDAIVDLIEKERETVIENTRKELLEITRIMVLKNGLNWSTFRNKMLEVDFEKNKKRAEK